MRAALGGAVGGTCRLVAVASRVVVLLLVVVVLAGLGLGLLGLGLVVLLLLRVVEASSSKASAAPTVAAGICFDSVCCGAGGAAASPGLR